MCRPFLSPKRTSDLRLTALLLLIALLPMPMAAQNDPPAPQGDTIVWYTVRPGDTLIGLTERYLGSPKLWPENMKLNPQVKDPRHLRPGSRIRLIASRALPKRNAVVNRVAHRVEAKPDPQPWTTARQGDLLKENDGVRTYERSSTELAFGDGSRLAVTENSLLFLKELRQPANGVTHDTIEIVDGQVDLRSVPRKSEAADVEFIVGSASIANHASAQKPVTARSRKTTDAHAQVMVYGGSSRIASAGQSVNVPAGMGTEAAPGKPPAPPQRLLPAPHLVAPAAGAMLQNEFSWQPVPGAAAYTVEVFRDSAATQLVDRVPAVREASWRPTSDMGGTLYWRVTAVAASGLDGFPSPTSQFRASSAADSLTGSVIEDTTATGRADFSTPLGGVRLIAYRDDGNGSPDDADTRVGETRSDTAGRFAFQGLSSGTYWIAADSTSIAPSAGLNQGASAATIWAEQTFGSAGALCGSTVRDAAGPCVGGRLGTTSDAPSRLSTSKHVARVTVSGEPIAPIAFGFSFDVVDETGDSAGVARSGQGSLRQFLRNANAIRGGNAMHFVPLDASTSTSWAIQLSAPLPEIVDADTQLLGTAWDASDPIRPRISPGPNGEMKPQLEIDASSADDVISARADTKIAAIAISTPGTALRARAAITVTASSIGVHPDGSPATSGQSGIVVEAGDARLNGVTIAGCRETSLRVMSGATLSATGLRITAASPAGTPVVAIDTRGAQIDDSAIDGGDAHPPVIVFGPQSGNARLNRLTIRRASDGVTVRGASSDNRFVALRFNDVSGAAFLFDPAGTAVPARNRISQSDFASVARLIARTSGNSAEAGKCGYVESSPNRGIAPVTITSFEQVPRGLLALYGRACIGDSVEIYQGIAGERNDAHFVQASAPAYDGTFALLVGTYTEATRMFVTATDKEGNTSEFAVSPPPKLGKK